MKRILPRTSRLIIARIIISGLLYQLIGSFAYAEMLGTDRIIQPSSNKQSINAVLLREDVKAVLLEHGVQAADVKHRLDQLTDSELQTLADEFKNLPAAGNPTLLLFLPGPIMLMLEMTGTTDMSTTF